MDFGPKLRKRLWYTAAVGSLASVTGLAAVSVVASVAPAASPSQGNQASTGRQLARPVVDGKVSKDGTNSEAVEVPCDADDLIAALVHANAAGGGTLDLAQHCTYTLTAYEHQTGSGLPEIEQPITINGNDSTIVRAANASSFRIFFVGVGGNLTLRDVTVKGGAATGMTPGGGGMFVQEGGKATVESSTFTENRTTNVGGAIANYGITKVTGDAEHGKDGTKDGATEPESKDGLSESGSKDGTEDEWTEDEWSGGKDGVGSHASTITKNHAWFDGGGIYNRGLLTVEQTRLSYNNSVFDDGGALANVGVAKLTKTKVDHNQADDNGGGIFAIDDAITKLAHSYVTDNTAGNLGGGIFNQESALYVYDSVVRHNTSEDNGGGIQNTRGQLVVDDSKVNDNTTRTGDGGGLRNAGGPATAALRDSHVDLNQAIGPISEAGGISNDDGEVTLTRTSVSENSATNPAGGIETNTARVSVDDESVIIKNRPTNCQGPVPNCFG